MVLVTVLVAPFFIDWSNHREIFEREASALIGHPVRVKGLADAQILPIPTFTFSNVEVGDPDKAPLMSAARLKIRMELMPLLQRKIEVIDVSLETPQVSMRLAEDGYSNWGQNGKRVFLGEKYTVKLGPVTIQNGGIYIVDEVLEQSLMVSDISATMSAQSLAGPWKLEGSAKAIDEIFQFKVNTGKLDGTVLRTKTTIMPQAFDFDLILDGDLDFQEEKTKAPAYGGTLNIKKRPQPRPAKEKRTSKKLKPGWTLAGRFDLNRRRFLLSQSVFEDGAREAPLNLVGSVRVPFGAKTRFDAVVSSRQIDLDRAYGKGQKEPLALDRAQTVIANVIRSIPKPPIPGNVSIDVPGIVVGGDIIRAVRFDATPIENGWKIDDLGAVFPGQTQVKFNGTIVADDALLVDGGLELRSDRPTALARWWRPSSKTEARRIRVRDFNLTTRLSAEKEAVRLRDMTMTIGTSDLSGRLAFNRISERQNRFDATLSSTRLDIDAIQAMATLFVGKGNTSGFGQNDTLSLKLRAETLVSEAVRGHDADINLRIANGEIDITTLKIADFAGANIDLSGSVRDILTKPAGRFGGKVMARETAGLIQIGETLFPGHAALDYIKKHGENLMPLDVEINFSGDQKNDNESDFAATITGNIGGGDITAGLRFQGDLSKAREGEVEVSVLGDYEDSMSLLKQVGWPVVDIGTAGSMNFDITARGKGSHGIAIKSIMTMADTKLDGSTTVKVSPDDKISYDGSAHLAGRDIEPLLQGFGYALPATGLGTDIDISFNVKGDSAGGQLKNLTGEIGGSALSGTMAYKAGSFSREVPWKWTGDLEIERLSLPWLTSFGTGEIIMPIDFSISAESVGEAGNVTDSDEDSVIGTSFWSQSRYGNPYLSSVHLDVTVKTPALEIIDLKEITDSQFLLRLRPASLSLTGFTGRFAGGDVSGSLRFENLEGMVSTSGLMEIKGADASDLLWSDENRPLIEGDLGLSFQFEGTGRSLDALVANLGGGGSVMLEKGRFRRVNPAAFGLIIKAADKNIDIDDKTVRPLVESHLDAGLLDVEKAEGAFTITSGVMRFANMTFRSDDIETLARATIDLPEMKLKGSMALSIDAAKIDKTPVSGSTPEIAILFEGPIDQPARSFDLQPLLGYLTIRRFEQEVQRVEILQTDILERQRLSRYVRWIEAEETRVLRENEAAEKLRIEAEKADRARLIEEDRKRQAAAAREIRAQQRARAATAARRSIKRAPINIEEELNRIERESITRPENIPVKPLELLPRIQ